MQGIAGSSDPSILPRMENNTPAPGSSEGKRKGPGPTLFIIMLVIIVAALAATIVMSPAHSGKGSPNAAPAAGASK
jgi:flagellar basal body-associated protein FliL